MRLETVVQTKQPRVATREACEAAAHLGLLIDDLPARGPIRCTVDVADGAVTLVTGPSGSGKSSVLAAAIDAAELVGVRVVDRPARVRPDRSVLGALGCAIDEAMTRLAEVGLGDSAVFTRRVRELSDGQRDRLDLARMIARADRFASRGQRAMIAVDEFATRLDDVTAHAVARCFGRAIGRRRGVSALVARPDPAVVSELPTAAHIALRADGTPDETPRAPRVPTAERIHTRLGHRDDYRTLAHHHYRPGGVACAVRYRAAVDPTSGETIGVLVTGMPTVHAGWRKAAWGDDYASGDRSRDLSRLNADVRRIARVIVDPRYRGLGIASRLVREELADALTARTEAVAAMASWCPFFETAGMREVHAPRSEIHARLADAFEHAGIETWRLADWRGVWRRLMDSPWRGFAERELHRWRRSTSVPREARRSDDLRVVLRHACRTVAVRHVAYVWERP